MIMVYVVCRDREEARRISRSLLEQRLAACTNMFPIESMYWWQGQLVEDSELVLIVKTVPENYADVAKHVKGMHSYEVPAIIRLPVAGADAPYLAWIQTETQACESE